MADYDCEYCGKSINNGGKCSKFEYNCPFSIVSNYDEEIIKKFQIGFKTISNTIDEMMKLDTEFHFDELEYLKEIVEEKSEIVSEKLLTEWTEMNDENKKYCMMTVQDNVLEDLNIIFCKTTKKLFIFFVNNNSLTEKSFFEIMKDVDVFENIKINIYPNNGYIDLNLDSIKFPTSKKINYYLSKDNLKFYAEDQISKEEFLTELELIEM